MDNEELKTLPNKKYEILFEKFKEINTIPVENWKVPHVLGYFVKKYKDQYKLNYNFKFNTPLPSKCFEVWKINSLSSKLSSNPKILKEYIDWIFTNEVPKLKKRFTSISLLTKEEYISYYKTNVYFTNFSTIDRSTKLKPEYIEVFKELKIDLETYGDLSFINKMQRTTELSNAFSKLEALGVDLSVLDKIV